MWSLSILTRHWCQLNSHRRNRLAYALFWHCCLMSLFSSHIHYKLIDSFIPFNRIEPKAVIHFEHNVTWHIPIVFVEHFLQHNQGSHHFAIEIIFILLLLPFHSTTLFRRLSWHNWRRPRCRRIRHPIEYSSLYYSRIRQVTNSRQL